VIPPGIVPFEQMPGLPPLFLRYVGGNAGEFLPGSPTLAAVAQRARELSKNRGSARIAAGQQAGLFTGPLYSLIKAAAALRLAEGLGREGIAARGVFWIATEDHDLAEVSQVTLLEESGPETFRLAEPSEKNFQPAGTVPLPGSIEAIFRAVRNGSAEISPAGELFERIWTPGKTFGAAFRETMEALLPDKPIDWIDPLDSQWRDEKLAFFRRALESAPRIVGALDSVEEKIRAAGFSPQVQRAESDFPCFLIENGVRRKIAFDGAQFRIHGNPTPFSAAALADHAEQGGHDPSPAALLRPVLQSWLFPVAAQILGPSELAYHAQSTPLFAIFDLEVPILLPRPHLIPRGARERRAQEALAIPDPEIFRAREASKSDAPPVAMRLRDLGARLAAELEMARPEIDAIDPTLTPAVAGTAEKIAHQIDRLREKVERAAERRDLDKNRRLETIERALTPGGAPADRVYTPLTYLLRFGDAFVPRILEAAECRLDGAHFVDLE
jgi:bacillithiol biosynthesis cysteine-adding enzyme BshC